MKRIFRKTFQSIKALDESFRNPIWIMTLLFVGSILIVYQGVKLTQSSNELFSDILREQTLATESRIDANLLATSASQNDHLSDSDLLLLLNIIPNSNYSDLATENLKKELKSLNDTKSELDYSEVLLKAADSAEKDAAKAQAQASHTQEGGLLSVTFGSLIAGSTSGWLISRYADGLRKK